MLRTWKNHYYGRLRRSGYNAKDALRAAKTWDAFTDAERDGLVRLRAEPEQESYFDVYGEPEGFTALNGRRVTAEQEREEIAGMIDRDGCWWIVAEWQDSDGFWHAADSVGMCIYRSPLDPGDNWYIPDLMQSALDALEADQDATATEEAVTD
jgi:hypothetical protein